MSNKIDWEKANKEGKKIPVIKMARPTKEQFKEMINWKRQYSARVTPRHKLSRTRTNKDSK